MDTNSSSVQCSGYKLSSLDGCPILAWVRLQVPSNVLYPASELFLMLNASQCA